IPARGKRLTEFQLRAAGNVRNVQPVQKRGELFPARFFPSRDAAGREVALPVRVRDIDQRTAGKRVYSAELPLIVQIPEEAEQSDLRPFSVKARFPVPADGENIADLPRFCHVPK